MSNTGDVDLSINLVFPFSDWNPLDRYWGFSGPQEVREALKSLRSEAGASLHFSEPDSSWIVRRLEEASKGARSSIVFLVHDSDLEKCFRVSGSQIEVNWDGEAAIHIAGSHWVAGPEQVRVVNEAASEEVNERVNERCGARFQQIVFLAFHRPGRPWFTEPLAASFSLGSIRPLLEAVGSYLSLVRAAQEKAAELSYLPALSILCQAYLSVFADEMEGAGKEMREALKIMDWTRLAAALGPKGLGDADSRAALRRKVQDPAWWRAVFPPKASLVQVLEGEWSGAGIGGKRTDLPVAVRQLAAIIDSPVASPSGMGKILPLPVAKAFSALDQMLRPL